MAVLITIASQKGGVGKTTSSVNLAASLALAGHRTLLVDLDPQGNASSGVGFTRPGAVPHRPTAGDGLLSASQIGKPLTTFVQATRFEALSAILSSPDLSQLETIQEVQGRGLSKFREALGRVASEFEYVLMDCPPSLGGLPTIALSVSDKVLIPVQCEYYAMEGLSQILPIVNKIQGSTNPRLEIGGLLLTMFSSELDLSQDVLREVSGYFPDAVFRTVIPRDVVLAEAASHGLPSFYYDPLARGTWSYLELAKEVLEHEWTQVG